MSYLNIWRTEAVSDDSDLDSVIIDGKLSTREDDRDRFNTFDYDDWLIAAAHVVNLMDQLDDGEALVITKEIS